MQKMLGITFDELPGTGDDNLVVESRNGFDANAVGISTPPTVQ
jgi:hypothetical protein